LPYIPETPVRHGIRCLLFDLGDTLWYRADQSGWTNLENESNQRAIDLLRRHINPVYLAESDDCKLGQDLRREFDLQIRTEIRHAPLLEPDSAGAIARVLEAWNITGYTRALCTQLFEALRVRLPNSRPLFADALSTLTELRRRGFLMGIVTNRLWGGEPFYEDIQTIGLLRFFQKEHIAVSGDMGLRKPNPDIFEHTLKALQVSPQETAMIGDSLSADILGAQQLGIYSIWKPKTWLRDWAIEHAPPTVQLEQTDTSPIDLSRETFPGIDTADTQMPEIPENSNPLPQGVYVTDDDYILTRASKGRGYLEQFQRGEIMPDRVIRELAELLELFPEVT
jgi:HAD superfamily hydrolase (TIGR01509 family)